VHWVAPGAEWSFYRGRTDASSPEPDTWRAPGFAAAGWERGRAPFFYGEPLTGTPLTDMRGEYSTLYLRHELWVANPGEAVALRFGAVADDGFVAWLNGLELVRDNAPSGELSYRATALSDASEPVAFRTFDISVPQTLLRPGLNVLAVQALNASIEASDDFVFDALLAVDLDREPPAVQRLLPAAGERLRELLSVEVAFTEAVLGVEAVDLLVNGQPATNVITVAPELFLFTFPPPPPGPVTLAWRPDHGITDRVGPAHPFAGGTWQYLIAETGAGSAVLLSEFMADNSRTLNDEDGESSDWIELFNSGTEPVDLAGWCLTDDPRQLAKWRFPELTLEPKTFLVVFASQKNKTDPAARLHTNFRIDAQGEYLALLDAATNVVSEFAPVYPKQQPDVSYGRVLGENRAVGYFTAPTPGVPNATSGPGFAPAVRFSQLSRTFTETLQLELSVASSPAQIRYTLDGNPPSHTSSVYTVPITLATSTQVRARAYQDGLLPGPLRSETYLALSNNVLGFRSDLPVLVLHALGKGVPSSSRTSFAHLSVYEPVDGWTSLTNPPTLSTRSGLQIRGSSTAGYGKSSFKLEFWDEFDLDLDRPILGLPADSDWVLYAPNNFDVPLIHNPFVHQLSRDMGFYSPRTRFVEVYLNRTVGPVNAQHYQGIYVLEEKIKIGRQRVRIDRLEPEHLTLPEVSGGYLLKFDRLDPGDSGLAAGGVAVAHVDPKERELRTLARRPQLNYLRDYLNAFWAALRGANWRDPVLGYPAYIEPDQWIDFHVLEVLSGNVDALVLSTYFYKPRNGKLHFGPHWDFDRALGSTDGRDANPRTWNTGPFFSGSWWSKLFTDKDFWQQWVDRWQHLRATSFAREHIDGLIDRLAAEVWLAQPREYQKWRVAPRKADGRPAGTYATEIQWMKNWLSNRIDFIDRQLTQPPAWSAPGGRVPEGTLLTLSGPAGAALYFTTTGADPRAPQGGQSIDSQLYAGPIELRQNTRLVARAYDPTKRQLGGPPSASWTPWSAPVTVTFTVTRPPLLVTELMYHPLPPPAGSPFASGDFEFLELRNHSLVAVDLAGYRFTAGIDYTFGAASSITTLAPGQRLLLVKNQAAFLSRYPPATATAIAGEYSGSLDNAGERLALIGPLGETLFDFAYDNRWAPLANGHGFSIVATDEQMPASRLGELSAWRLSARPGGSPGGADAAPLALPPVCVNEALTHTDPPQSDTIELHNPSSAPADVSGWHLTDDFTVPAKYRFPPATVVPAGGFVVVEAA